MPNTSIDPLDIGPQYPRDDPFTARMRFHQSWYRSRILKVAYGTGPKTSNKTFYGSMLTLEDGERGLNFLLPHIFQVAKRRLADKHAPLDSFRLLCNMLSSQSMAFNLFAPLVDNLDLATRLLQSLLPGEVSSVSKVYFEFIPEPTNAYLNDRTAFDVFIDYEKPGGYFGFLALETKLAESHPTKVYANPHYHKWTGHEHSPFLSGARPELESPELNQLWRDHLLAVAMLLHPESSYASGHFMLVYPAANPVFARASARYKTLLDPAGQTFINLPLERLVETWTGLVENTSFEKWLDRFSQRYLDLDASALEFQNANPSGG